MDAVGIERGESRGATSMDALQYLRYCSWLERVRELAARAVRGAGNAGRGASPTDSKREYFFF
jgi:hypothetical protein